MAKLIVQGTHCTATMTEPDEDGDYGWTAPCGAGSTEVRPMDEAIAHAEIHADACGSATHARVRDSAGSIWHLCPNGNWSLYPDNPRARWTLNQISESYGPLKELTA
jgi:hypothetical protein